MYNTIINQRIEAGSIKKMLPLQLKKPSNVVPERLTTEKLGKEKPRRIPTNGH